MWSDLRFRVRSLFRRRAVERELDAEMLFHVQRLVDTYVSSGLDLQAARRRARREFGSFDQIREAHRDARGVRVLEELVLDFRQAIRAVGKRPLFACTASLTLACGIRRDSRSAARGRCT